MPMLDDEVEKDSDTDRWMVSYADFITLLFAFFVVMYAISSVNVEKYRVLSATLEQTFSADSRSLEPIQVGEPSLDSTPHIVDVPDVTGFADADPGDTQIKDPLEAAATSLAGFTALEGVSVHSNPDWVEISVGADLLFAPGRVELAEAAESKLAQTLDLLRQSTHAITIEGYTDNVPSSSAQFPSNWELSAARAAAVARYYVAQGIRRNRIAAVGYGENHPLETNATPNGRAANRRVVIVIARRSELARNRNATAVVKTATPPAAKATGERLADGRLIFSNDNFSNDNDEREATQ